jgi:hypothetical protein
MPEGVRQWAFIEGFPNYMVSSEGDVYNVKHKRYIATYMDGTRKIVSITAGNKRHKLPVKRLVEDAFGS